MGFLEVLRCMGVNAQYAEKLPLVRQQVDQLSELASRWHGLVLELAYWRSMSPGDIGATVERLGDVYTQFCELLDVFCTQLGMEVDYTVCG